jgi:hypothetical protein
VEPWILATLGISLGLTLLLEGLIALVVGVRDKKDLLLVCLVNVLTNPAVVLCYHLNSAYIGINQVLVKLILEALAVLTEGLYYRKYASGIRHPFWFSVLANGFSFGVGLLLNKLI